MRLFRVVGPSALHTGLIRHSVTWVSIIIRLVDVFSVVMILPLATSLYGIRWTVDYGIASMACGLCMVFVFSLVDVYRPWYGTTFFQEVLVILQGWLITIGILFIGAWAIKETATYSRVVIGIWFLGSFSTILLTHWMRRLVGSRLRARQESSRRALIVGAGKLGEELAKRLGQDWMGIRVVGFYDDDKLKHNTLINGVTILGSTLSAVEKVATEAIDLVYIALPFRVADKINELVNKFENTTATVYVAPDLFLFDMFNARWYSVDGIPVVTRSENPFTSTTAIVKRFEDIILATALLFLLGPIMVIIAVWVGLSSSGPVIYKQLRCGVNGKTIVVWKFRTMIVDLIDKPYRQATKGDSRLTPCGRFLRKHSLDELPQFFNVLQGRLSLVGPRPHPPALDEQYRELNKSQIWRRKVRPGITGWAQVHGLRGETEESWMMTKRMEYDLYYIDNWSLIMDFKIIFMTIPHLLGHGRAY